MGFLIAAVFLVIVGRSVGLSALISPWKLLSPVEIAVGLCLLFFSYVVRSLRMYDYFIEQMRGDFGKCLRMVVYHTFFNNMLPMRSGELAFPVLMKRYFGVPVARTLPALMWFRALDLHILVLAGTSCLILHADLAMAYAFVPAALLITPALLLPVRNAVGNLISSHTSQPFVIISTLIEGIPDNKVTYFKQWLLTTANWAIKLAVFAWIMQRFVAVPYATALLASLLGETSTVLPIQGLAGAGTYEGGIMLGLASSPVDTGQALQAALGVHVFILGAITLTAAITLIVNFFTRDNLPADT